MTLLFFRKWVLILENKLERKYGLFTAICMVVGIVIGSGVFFKAQNILQKTGGDVKLGIVAWLIGGAIMLACLLTFSFMGQKYERVNGVVDYAEATMGKRYGYLIGWYIAVMYFPAMTSVLAWLSARYTLEFVVSVNPNFPLLIPAAQGGCVVGPECLALALFYTCAVYAMNSIAPKLAGKFQTTTTIIKFIPLVLMSVVGIIYGLANGTLAQNIATTAVVEQSSGNPLFAGVCATAFAYEGWIIATSINAEIKDSKKNLPKALIIGGFIIIATYLFYFIGANGGATVQELVDVGPTLAFTNIFGGVLGNILNLFIAISCLGTTNGLMMACTRSFYSLAVRGNGPAPKVVAEVDAQTNTPNNSAIISLICTGAWFLYFYLSNLAGTWTGAFVFDSTELPIIFIYGMYVPMMIQWMRKEKDESVFRRFIMPALTIIGCLFMVFACILSHKIAVVWYLIVFAVVMAIGLLLYKKKEK